MKKINVLAAASFILATSFAFTTAKMPPPPQSVRRAINSTKSPCELATAICGHNGGVCQDATYTYFDPNDTKCVLPLERP